MWNYRTLEDKMKPVLLLLWVVRLFAPKYHGIRDSNRDEPVHVIEFRKCTIRMPFSGREYDDFQVTYLTKDGRMFTVPETLFYKFYGREV